MKITIEQEGETKVYADVVQFALVGVSLKNKLWPQTFRHSHSTDFNELLGLLTTLQEDLLDKKMELNYGTQSKSRSSDKN